MMDDLNFEDHEEHPDERWLVSYADMMTLLFGLFVLLFSMSTMDPEASKKIKESTEKQFGKVEEEALEETPEEAKVEVKDETAELKAQLAALTDQLQNLSQERDDLLLKNQELMNSQPEPVPEDHSEELKRALRKSQRQIAKLENQIGMINANDQSADLKNQIKDLERQLAGRSSDKERFNEFRKQIIQLRNEKEALKKMQLVISTKNQELMLDLKGHREEISSYNQRITRLKDQLTQAQIKRKEIISKAKSFAQKKASQSKELSSQLQTLERKLANASSIEDQFKTLQSENRSLASQTKSLSQKNAELSDKIKDIQKRLDDQSRRSFMAFSINWSSRDHDIDLTIEDPKGQKFDFKKRKYSGHPGNFSLDTRRGPGAELWQTEKLIPGRYKASYYFFNQYGNVSNAKIFGTIFTPKGSTDLPVVEMDFSKNRKHEIIFDVENDGTIKFLSK